MRKIIAFIFALTFLTSNSFADITFWTTEVQPARMEKQMEMAKSFETKTGIKVEVIPVEEKDLGSRATACLLYTSPSPRDRQKSRMPSSA